jgi:cytochrome P450
MSANPPRRTAPGPPGTLLLGHVSAFRNDPLELVTTATAEYGDIVRFRLGPHVEHLLNHPDHAAHVLQKRRGNYDKDCRSTSFIKRVCGESLLTASGDVWQHRRSLLQPAFHRNHVHGFADLMVDATTAMLERWPRSTGPVELDLASEMMRLTYTIVARGLFSADLSSGAERIKPAMRLLLEETFTRIRSIFNPPSWLPTPGNRRFDQALGEVKRVALELIEEHRSDRSAKRHDLLTMLLGALDPDGDDGFGIEQLRDEVVTLLIAGHETTANALTWTFHLLATHPGVQDRVHDELSTVLNGRNPTLDDIPKLELTTKVIKESMRLYPPVWIIERRALADDTIGGFHIPKNSSVVICPWTMHRHPDFWEAPGEFQPDRFDQAPPPAYLPFGGGPRVCIGHEFAMLEARIATAMILQRYRLRPVSGAPVEPHPGITLPPLHGLPLIIEPLS